MPMTLNQYLEDVQTMGRNADAFEARNSEELRKPGAYRFWKGAGKKGITFGCPCGCGAKFAIQYDPPGWVVEGEWPKVTANPSLGCMETNGSGHWHGYLRNGVFEEC